MMADIELWNALNVIARNLGLMDEQHELDIKPVGPPPAIDFDKVDMWTDSPEIQCDVTQNGYRCCKLRGHEDLHVDKHGRAMIWRKDEPGKRPEFDPAPAPLATCAARGVAGHVCYRPPGHDGWHRSQRDGSHLQWPDEPGTPGNDVASPDPIVPRT